MKKLYKIAESSDLMNIDIQYGKTRYTFNLAEELKLQEGSMHDRLKRHASSYAFLTQLLTHLETNVDELERRVKKTYDKLYVKCKKKLVNGRPMSDDLCKATAGSSPIYQKAVKQSIQAKHSKNVILRAVRAYETRKDLMQTISANLRNEK